MWLLLAPCALIYSHMGKCQHCAPLRELRLPRDILILSLSRERKVMKVDGFTRFRVGDLVTVVGLEESLEELSLQFGQ